MNGFADVFEMAVKKLKIAENYRALNMDTDVNNAKSQHCIRAKKSMILTQALNLSHNKTIQ